MDWNDIKNIPRGELMRLLPSDFSFKTEPWSHQLAAFLATISNDGFLDALDLGTGKTKVAIDCVRYYDNNKGEIKVLFTCLNTAVEKMAEEVRIHSDLEPVCLRGSSKEKWELINQEANFYIINYEGLRALLTDRVKREPSKKGKDVLNYDSINVLAGKNFDVLVIDESHKIKNRASLTYKIISALSRKIDRRILLTGTPFGNSLLDIWPQYYIIDRGETFGSNFYGFRKKYFENREFVIKVKGIKRAIPNWKPTEIGEAGIKENLWSYALRYKEDEIDDLPPKVFRVLRYKLGKKQRKEYNDLIKGSERSKLTKDVLNRAMAFRQISSGFIKSSGYVFKENPKLDLLTDLIETVVDEHKMVIFTDFTMSRKIIEKRIKKMKIKFCSLSGETPTLEKHNQQKIFQNDPDYRIMVAQIRSGGASIDLIAATYCIHYELCRSVIDYKQSIKRIHRGGQTRRCYFYNLIGNNTLETNIYKDLESGVDAFSRIVDDEGAKRYLIGE